MTRPTLELVAPASRRRSARGRPADPPYVTAIVVAGAGARGAYEAGALSVLIPRLLASPGREGAKDRIVIIGTSAGAINTVALAAHADPDEAIRRTVDLWTSVDVADVFAPLPVTAARTIASLVPLPWSRGPRVHSLLDSSPLRRTMRARLDWDDLRLGLNEGTSWVDTAGIVTTACDTGRTTVFLQGAGEVHGPAADHERGIDFVSAQLDVAHVLASAAIPIAFRPVRIDRPGPPAWHVDGGVRLNVPIKPALALHADRVVVVSTAPDPDLPQPRAAGAGAPDIFDAAGTILNAVLNDRMAEDVRTLRRTNDLIEAGHPVEGGATGPNGTRRPRMVVPHLCLGPPDPDVIPDTAIRVFKDRYHGWKRISDLGVLGRIIGGSADTRGELLSHLFFDAEFHAALVELGRDHASATLGPADADLPWRDDRPGRGRGAAART